MVMLRLVDLGDNGSELDPHATASDIAVGPVHDRPGRRQPPPRRLAVRPQVVSPATDDATRRATQARQAHCQRADAESIRMCLTGDWTAFRRIVEVHQGLIFHFLRINTGSAFDVEDLAQRVFIRAYRCSCRTPTIQDQPPETGHRVRSSAGGRRMGRCDRRGRGRTRQSSVKRLSS